MLFVAVRGWSSSWGGRGCVRGIDINYRDVVAAAVGWGGEMPASDAEVGQGNSGSGQFAVFVALVASVAGNAGRFLWTYFYSTGALLMPGNQAPPVSLRG